MKSSVRGSIYGIKTPYISSETLTNGVTKTYTATKNCLAILALHIKASGNGQETITLNNVDLVSLQTDGACNYIDTVTLQLKPGDVLKVYLSTGATDSKLNIAELV